jgi:hypothetical protein
MYLISAIYNLCERRKYVFNVLLEYSIITLFYVGEHGNLCQGRARVRCAWVIHLHDVMIMFTINFSENNFTFVFTFPKHK